MTCTGGTPPPSPARLTFALHQYSITPSLRHSLPSIRAHPRPSLTDPRSTFYADRHARPFPPPLALAHCPGAPARPRSPHLGLSFDPSRLDSLDLPSLESPRLGGSPDLPPRTPLVHPTRPP